MRLGAHHRRGVAEQQRVEGLVLRRAHPLRVVAGHQQRGTDQDRDRGGGGADRAVAGVPIAVDQEELQAEDDGADAERGQMGVQLGLRLHRGRRRRREVVGLPRQDRQDGQTDQGGDDQRRRPWHRFTRTHLVVHSSNVRRSWADDRCLDES
jgi:hypothetical protein